MLPGSKQRAGNICICSGLLESYSSGRVGSRHGSTPGCLNAQVSLLWKPKSVGESRARSFRVGMGHVTVWELGSAAGH